MTITLKNLVPGTSQLTASAATYYTAPNGTGAKINNASAMNTDSSARTFTVHIVPSGGTASNSNMVINAKALQPGETYNCPELVGKNIMTGGTIQALASVTTTVSFQVSGIEQT